MNLTAILISMSSIIVSITSLLVSVVLWRHTNRPIVIARVSSTDKVDIHPSLNILLENTGNRPAKNIKLIALEKDLQRAAFQEEGNTQMPQDAKRCFFSKVVIPVLANNKKISSGFGYLGRGKGAWIDGSKIPITIEYYDLNNRKFIDRMDILLVDDKGFAQSFWSLRK